jgi:hypothetical protein
MQSGSPPGAEALDKEIRIVDEDKVESLPSTSDDGIHDEPKPEAPDPNIVDWEGDDDPANPQNWPIGKKWRNIAVVGSLALLT